MTPSKQGSWRISPQLDATLTLKPSRGFDLAIDDIDETLTQVPRVLLLLIIVIVTVIILITDVVDDAGSIRR